MSKPTRVQCGHCEHFCPDPDSHEVNAIGECFQGVEPTGDDPALRPWVERICPTHKSILHWPMVGGYALVGKITERKGRRGGAINASVGFAISQSNKLVFYASRGGSEELVARLATIIDAEGLGLLKDLDWRKLARDCATHREVGMAAHERQRRARELAEVEA